MNVLKHSTNIKSRSGMSYKSSKLFIIIKLGLNCWKNRGDLINSNKTYSGLLPLRRELSLLISLWRIKNHKELRKEETKIISYQFLLYHLTNLIVVQIQIFCGHPVCSSYRSQSYFNPISHPLVGRYFVTIKLLTTLYNVHNTFFAIDITPGVSHFNFVNWGFGTFWQHKTHQPNKEREGGGVQYVIIFN